MESQFISVVIPFLNEEENIPDLVAELQELVQKFPELRFEFVFVDDGSTDNSVKVLFKNLRDPLLWKIIKLSRNYGSYNALRVGVLQSSAEIVSFIYADRQDPVSLLPQMFEKIKEGNDIVIAARKSTRYRFTDKFFSVLHAMLVRKFIVSTFPNMGFDVVMFTKSVKDRLNENIESDSNIFLQILRSGYRQATIEYDKVERTKGISKWSFSAKLKASLDVMIGFSYLPVRFISITGIFLFLAGIFAGVAYFLSAVGLFEKTGMLPLSALLLICFGLTNISLGILGEYLWRILNAARKRPAFTVDEVIVKPAVEK